MQKYTFMKLFQLHLLGGVWMEQELQNCKNFRRNLVPKTYDAWSSSYMYKTTTQVNWIG